MTKRLSPERPYGAICRDCATDMGATSPANHAYTAWMGECDQCQQQKICCDSTDWDWPGVALKPDEREF